MPDLKAIISDKVRRLETIPDAFLSNIERTEKGVYAKLLELLDQLKVDASGNVVMTKANLAKAEAITTELKKVLYGSEYTKALTEFAGEFNTQKTINEDYFSNAFPEFTGSDLADELVNISRRQTIELLSGQSLDAAFFNPIKQQMINSVATGASRVDMIKSIRDIAMGGDGVEGKLLSYSKQIAHDAFALSDRSYSATIAEDLGIEWFKYSGDKIATSRPFCVERHEKYYHKKEIQAWGDGKNLGVPKEDTGLWAGAMRGTNSATIFKTAGGYNCRHSIIGVSISVVPPGVVKRNVDNGNYNG